jgi:hypothetical protein
MSGVEKCVNTVTVSKTLGISEDYLQRLAREPGCPCYRVGRPAGKGGRLRWSLPRLEVWLLELAEASRAAPPAPPTVPAPTPEPPNEDQFARFLADLPDDLDEPTAKAEEIPEESEGLSLDQLISGECFTTEEAQKAGIIA